MKKTKLVIEAASRSLGGRIFISLYDLGDDEITIQLPKTDIILFIRKTELCGCEEKRVKEENRMRRTQ